MGLEKAGLEFIAWARTSGAKSLLTMKPVKVKGKFEGLTLAPKLNTDVAKFSKSTATQSRIPQATNAYSTAASQGTEQAEQVVLKEHGLSEIMSDTVHKPTIIGQTPVHSPLRPDLPEHYIKVEGQIIPYEYGAQGRAASYKITPSTPNEYTEIFEARFIDGHMEQVSLGPGKYVQFYDKDGWKVGARIRVPRTSIMTKEEYTQYLEELKKKTPKVPTTPKGPIETQLEKSINGLTEPQRTAQRSIKLDEEGNTIVRFLDDKGSFLRKVKLNPDGQVLEYTDFRTFVSGQGIKYGGYLSGLQPNGCRYSSSLNSEIPLEQVQQFDEAASRYMRVREKSRYILNPNGEVDRTIQTRILTPHIKGQLREPVTRTVDVRSMGDGRFVEDVLITKGDKRFERSFWFDQKTGNVHQMDGWCKGLTKEEIELIKSDPFLASRYYNDGLDFVRAEKFNAYKTQKLRDKQTVLSFKTPSDSGELGHYHHADGLFGNNISHINITPTHVANGHRGRVVNTMHHEPRHGFQHQMIDDFNANLLQGEEKAQAQIFKDNFNHYKRPEIDGFNAYYNQTVEVDARKAGEVAQKQFEENGDKIDNIFFNIT